jgi:putative hemolysin
VADQLLVIFSMVLCSAFFSGIEIAFLSANKLRIELESNQGYIPGKILSFFLKKPKRFITTTLVGNNIALVVYGIFTAELMEPFLEQYISSSFAVLFIQVVISTLAIVVTAEYLPKALFRINPNPTLNFLAIPFFLIYLILYPVQILVVGVAEFLLKVVFRRPIESSKIVFGRIDLDNYVKQFTSGQNGTDQFDHEIKIFQNALDFSEVKVRECMIPRTEIIALEVNESIDSLKDKFIETHLSKILIFEEQIDHIIGYVHSAELFKKPQTIREVLLPLAFVPETMHAKEILSILKSQRKSMAIVVDEFGGTAGMITTEDLLEEIFGEIEDEHDKEELIEKQIDENEFLLSARLEIDYLNEEFKLNLPVGDEYETLAGLILHFHGSLPQLGEEILIPPFLFNIQAATNTKIDLVKLTVLND